MDPQKGDPLSPYWMDPQKIADGGSSNGDPGGSPKGDPLYPYPKSQAI